MFILPQAAIAPEVGDALGITKIARERIEIREGPLAAVISTSYHVQLFSGSATVTVKFEFSAPAMGTPLRLHWYEVAPVAETVRLSVPPSGTTCRGEVMLVITGSVCAAPMTDRATKKTTSVKILIGNMV
jgi:hypothetical protein